MKHRSLIGLFVVCMLGALGWASLPGISRAATEPALTRQSDAIDDAVRAAFEQARMTNEASIAGFALFDTRVQDIRYSADQSAALLFLSLHDPLTGELIAAEPGLSIARSQPGKALTEAATWQIALNNRAEFAADVAALPADLLTDDMQMHYLTPAQDAEAQPQDQAPFTGYKLPWAAGVEKRLSGSIGHVLTYKSCETTCRYAYDWADGTMFPLLASKGGTVKQFQTVCPNGGVSCTNYLILEDQSTSPTSYQIYYHLAFDSIPARLRTVGTIVNQGDYIGDVDDTGYSSGHHLHYHVYTSATRAWEWGYSVPFVYDEVAINGGYPRTCAEANAFPSYGTECNAGKDGKRGTSDDDRFLSANTPAHPPSGQVILPASRTTVNTQSVLVGGTATDDLAVTRIQVLGLWNSEWHTLDYITPEPNGTFTKGVDLCAAGVPEGPFTMQVKIYDREGSQVVAAPGNLEIIKNFACGGVAPPPAPACSPNANQVALYTEPDYRGSCKKFSMTTNEVGTPLATSFGANNLGAVGDNNAASIQVGSNVQAVLYDLTDDLDQAEPEGRIETLEGNDSNLANNRIGTNRVSGMWLQARSTPPDEPFLRPVGARMDGANPSFVNSLVLSWYGGAGATSFDVKLTGPNTNSNWNTRNNSLSIGRLAAGSYSWSVKSLNSAGGNTTSASFTVNSAALPNAAARGLPYLDSMENGSNDWVADGLWRLGAVTAGNRPATQAWVYNNAGGGYAGPPNRGGDLTSPPINVPGGAASYLTFLYYANVEDGLPYWDQRWVQVVEADGKATDLYQLRDDKQPTGQFWLQSPPLSLAAFSGKTVRVRFHFDTVDYEYNSGLGWMIDDVSISAQGAASCEDTAGNTPASAKEISMGVPLVGATICPQGDIDYYKFTGQAGQPIVIDIDAQTKTPPSALDAQVFLIDSDGYNVIAENDDEVLQDRPDPLLSYTLQRSGTYYIKVKAWDYPGAGGVNYTYDLNVYQAVPQSPASINLVYPASASGVPSVPFEIVATAASSAGGPIVQMEFFWHGADWQNGQWIKFATDTTAGDGWWAIVDPRAYGTIEGAALYVQAKNSTGAALGTVLWDLKPDMTSPGSKLNALAQTTRSTAIGLTWTASDPQNDIDRFEFQYQEYTTGWSEWRNFASTVAGGQRMTWFVGQPGLGYAFRMRAVDYAGNMEDYPDTAEAVTSLEVACIPDGYETVESAENKAVALTGRESQTHNLCRDDVDRISFEVDAASKSWCIGVQSTGGGAGFTATLYGPSGEIVQNWGQGNFGQSILRTWNVMTPGIYQLQVNAFRPDLYGTDVTYAVYAHEPQKIHLPLISR